MEEGQDPPEGFEDLQEWRDFEVPFKSSLMQVSPQSCLTGLCCRIRLGFALDY